MRRLMKSFVEGIHLIKTNPEVAKRAIAKYMRMKDEKELAEAYEILDSLTQRKPYPTIGRIQEHSCRAESQDPCSEDR